MGILRISPNSLDENVDSWEDDPTSKLQSLYKGESGENDVKNRRSVMLSDSDGNDLGVRFQPMGFAQRTYASDVVRGVIYVTTRATNVFVSDNFNMRSTLVVGSDDPDRSHESGIIIRSKGSNDILHAKWLFYPTESPNDNRYFNNKNRLNLFDPSKPETPYEQTSDNLLKLPLDWYENPSPLKNGELDPNPQEHYTFDDSDYVTINGSRLQTRNYDEEAIPVLHTRDYVLGNYDGHSFKLGTAGTSITEGDLEGVGWINGGDNPISNVDIDTEDYVTKLSWLRIDDLIWETIEQVLSGTVRHYNGRYTNIGYETHTDPETGKIYQTTVNLNDKGAENGTKFFNMSSEGNNLPLSTAAQATPYGFLMENAEMLGQDVAPGLIMYNAMPLHRWAFHEMRQRLQNLEAEQRYGGTRLDGWRQEVQNYKKNGILSAYTVLNPSFTNNLTKNFILCDGREINYEKYPAMNTNNAKMFKQVMGNFRVARDNNSTPTPRSEEEQKNTIYEHLKKTPLLMSPLEKQPRLIRGASWNVPKEDISSELSNGWFENPLTDSVFTDPSNDRNFGYVGNDAFKNKNSIPYPIDSTQGKVYLYNYNIAPKSAHQHHVFVSGGNTPTMNEIIAKIQREHWEKYGPHDIDPMRAYSYGMPEFDNSTTHVIGAWQDKPWMVAQYNALNRPVPVSMQWYGRGYFAPNTTGAWTVFKHNLNQLVDRPKIYIDNSTTNVLTWKTSYEDSGSEEAMWWMHRASEQEGSLSLTERGGWKANFQNVWHRKCARYRVFGKCTGHYEEDFWPVVQGGAGAYRILGAYRPGQIDGQSEYGSFVSEDERCLTSLPYENVKYLGGSVEVDRPWNNSVQKRINGVICNSMTRWERHHVNSTADYSERTMEIDDFMPQSPSMGLLPLMRI